MTWSCAQIEERLSDYLDGLLEEAEIQEYAAHLGSCARCAPLARQVAHTVGRLRSLKAEELPQRLIPRILDLTLGPQTAKRDWRSWLLILWQPRFAMGAVTVFASLFILFQTTGVRPGNLTWASLNPMSLYRGADRHAHLVFARSVKFVNDLRVVYEIQSRLQPAAEVSPSQPESLPPHPQTQPKSPEERKQDRSASSNNVALLATVLAGAHTRSSR